MPIILSHDGKAWRLEPVTGEGFTRFRWVPIDPKPAQEEALEGCDE